MKTAKELRSNIIDLFDAHQAEVMRMAREEISEGDLLERSNNMIKRFIGEVEEYVYIQAQSQDQPAPLPDKVDMEKLCPFCGEGLFDKPGLKYHLENYCNVYSSTESI